MGLHLSRALALPTAYLAVQWIVGGTKMRDVALQELRLNGGERVLDLGCGPAYYLGRLPDVAYVGFDTDRRYVEWARRRWGSRGRFFCEELGERHVGELGRFDAVMMMGLLHHLDDPDCDALLERAGRLLAAGGRVVTLDTVLYQGQSGLSRFLAKNDRGDHVRTPAGFDRLARRRFEDVRARVVGDAFPVASAHYLMTMRGPRAARANGASA